jgi:hypothetical protein
MRTGQYDRAVQTFESLGPAYLEAAAKKYESTTSHNDPTWAPLRTARFLADSVRRERAAKTPGEKARIAYERGALLFHQRYELLYNGALWEGRRVYALQIAGPPGPSDIPTADRLLEQHEKEHTSLYQAILVFEHIAKDYPGTPEAPKALYSAAMCCTFMSNMDSYWSSHSDELEARAIGFYHRVQREYPQDPLAGAAAKFGGKA